MDRPLKSTEKRQNKHMQEDYPTLERWQKRKTRILLYIRKNHGTADVG